MGCLMDVDGLDENVLNEEVNGTTIDSDGIYKAKQKMIIKMKAKLFSWSGDDYTIYNYNYASNTNKNGNPLLKINGKPAFTSLMHITDLTGNIIAILDGKAQFFGYPKFHLQNPQKQTIAIITRDTSFGTVNFNVKSPNEQQIYYTVNGTFYDHRFVIRNRTGQIVGKSSRQLTNSGYHSYGVELCVGFDYVLMVLIMASIDEYEEHQRSID
eukprot:717847_1